MDKAIEIKPPQCVTIAHPQSSRFLLPVNSTGSCNCNPDKNIQSADSSPSRIILIDTMLFGVIAILSYIWAGMILLGIVTAMFTGRMPDVTNAAIESSKDAVQVCITMLGILSMWMGLMRIAEDAGAIKALSRKMRPVLSFLFPRLPKGCKALEYISTNMLANMLGLAWAATPAGLKAMEELQKFNRNKDTASDEMCMFMIVNMSSLQLVSVNIIAWRAQYNSADPSEIIGPGLAATAFSTIVAVIFAKAMGIWSEASRYRAHQCRNEAKRC